MKKGILAAVSARFLLFCVYIATVCDSQQYPSAYNYGGIERNPGIRYPQARYYGYYGTPRQPTLRYGPFASPNLPNSLGYQHRQSIDNNRRYASGPARTIETHFLPTQRNTATTVRPRRLNTHFQPKNQETPNSKGSFGEAIVPGDCKKEECCQPKEKWDPATESCLKTSKVSYRRRSP